MGLGQVRGGAREAWLVAGLEEHLPVCAKFGPDFFQAKVHGQPQRQLLRSIGSLTVARVCCAGGVLPQLWRRATTRSLLTRAALIRCRAQE